MSAERAKRDRGVCRGSLWCQEKPLLARRSTSGGDTSSKSLNYCVLVGANLSNYESVVAYRRGDHPLTMVHIVGASAWNPSGGKGGDSSTGFRLVTEQGTHLYCAAPTSTCRDLWLGALHAGLDRSLLEAGMPKQQPLQPPPPAKTGRLRPRIKKHCFSCGVVDDPNKSPIFAKCVPVTHYGKENRCDLCKNCLIAQGLLNHVCFLRELFASAQQERKAITLAKQLCFQAMKLANPALESQVGAAATAAANEESNTSLTTTTTSTNTTTTTTGEATQETAGSSSSSSNGSSKDSSSWSVVDDPLQAQAWIHLSPTPESTKAVMKLITSSAEFLSLQRVSLTLENCCEQIQQGIIGVPDMLEQIDNVMGTTSIHSNQQEMKKQAFRVAGDMGTAMKLLHDLALPRNAHQQQMQQHSNLDMFICLLEFLLDLCEGGELASVAAFWPQLCHIHLRMLPSDNIAQLLRVELLEDFLLTVSTRYSIHLALDLIWSHTADLEESLINTATCGPTCRRRRYAVLRFVCELESLLLGLPNGWGGGSVALGKLFTPSAHQDALIKLYMGGIHDLRKEVPQFLTRSVRMEVLAHDKFEKDPDEAVQEAMRIARNADYFSSHLNFSRRMCDIAEKMFSLDIKDRTPALERELGLLNASGTMGGDPLNRIMEHHLRVVGVPTKEGHVFRSKERTPVLLLMEVFDDTVEDDEEQQQTQLKKEREAEAAQTKGDSETKEPKAGQEKEEIKPETKAEKENPVEPAENDDNDDSDHFVDAQSDEGSVYEDPSEERLNNSSSFDLSRDEDGMYSPKHVRARTRSGAKYSSPSKEISLPLEGSLDDSFANHNAPHALKRFDNPINESKKETPQTPSMETVEEIVTHAMVKQLRLPDLETNEGTEQESMAEDCKDADEEKQTEQADKSCGDGDIPRSKSSQSILSDDGMDPAKRGSKKMAAIACDNTGDASNSFAPTGDVRREVLNAIFLKGVQGGNSIAAGTKGGVMQSLQELEHKRAVELLLLDSEAGTENNGQQPDGSYVETEKKKKKLEALGIENLSDDGLGDDKWSAMTEEDEALESIRLMLIQNRVAQGGLSPVAAAKVLQHASIQKAKSEDSGGSAEFKHDKDMPKVDAGDVDPRLVGCGDLPSAVLQALTLWKAGMVTNGELLELVSKDLKHGRRIMSQDPEVVDKLMEDSAFWGRFAFGERWAEKKARIALSSPHGKRAGWDLVGVIVKSNDDLRQETFVMQLIELCQEAFQVANLELWVHPYRILSTGRTTGILEMVRNAMSLDALKKRPGYGKGGLREHMMRMTEFMPDPANAFKAAQRNFVRSLAAYSLMSYLFLFKDRHNGNILLDTAGHIIHIDFGFVFGIAPGGSFSLEMSTPFKMTEEMLEVMGGMESPLFSEFVILFCCGFLALRTHYETFMALVEITSKESTFPCFEGKDSEDIVEKLRDRFQPDLDTEKAIAFALDLIQQSTSSYGTKQYDYFQYISQGIAT
ncbi:Phosphatidylinositol 4-kinase beta [Seminavis robusta]|uniref:1-phosphatidylinositol 4-kinase n=1 Tax=Seminavis robusta TaxID=568900 RepID=A0A9N8E295_9STRA|nr:Phosphatidylinositol 4-kinase beta [Seminavis robusta]|eukprot:Sro580_g170170.1 Phosphatidylinositol 4-kinase beta (1482) ;mRNA; r:40794-45310